MPATNFTHLTLRLLRLPTKAALAAAHGVATEGFRMLTVVGLHHDNDLSTTAGWGECSALNEPGYTPEWAEGAFDLLRSGRPFGRTTDPMATAAIEMAMLDAELKADGESLADRLGTTGQTATAGAAVGLGPLPGVLDQVEALAAAGYSRVKLKIAPGKIVVPVEAVRSSFPELDLHVDANGSLRPDDIPSLLRLRDLGVTVIEQPFPIDDHHSPSRLVAETDIAVAADEAVTTADAVHHLAADRAASAIVIKPPRLGGLRATLAMLDLADTLDMPASLGGMLESGLGRHALAALAPLPGFTITGDLSRAKRWLVEDPFPDIKLRKGKIEAPTRPGIAGDPARTRLERYTVRSAIVDASPALAAANQTLEI